MKTFTLTGLLFFCSFLLQSQVGINTINPNATLDIVSSNQAAPSNIDGLLIPKVDEFPAAFPTASQDGMMIYVTGNGAPSKGFYYWDQGTTNWVSFSTGSVNSEWIDNGTYLSPADGNNKDVTIGGANNPGARLTVRSDKEINTLITNTSVQNSVMVGLNTYLNNNPIDPVSSTIGVYNDVLNEGEGYLFGTWNRIGGDGIGSHRGILNDIYGAGTGEQIGVYSLISNTGNGEHFGTKNTLSGSGTGRHFGSDILLSGIGSGDQVGTRNTINNTGDGQHIGVHNFISAAGGGIQRGIWNVINNSGNNTHLGSENVLGGTGSGLHYGTYNYLTSTGAGSKYGSYQFIDTNAGGNHYGVYSHVLKPGSYAGYFLGSVAVGTTMANTYTLPASRGTNGQIMQTDGSGNVSWVKPSNFEDADWFESGTSNAPQSINDNTFTNGRVGINKSNPSAILDIETNTNVTNNFSIDNTFDYGSVGPPSYSIKGARLYMRPLGTEIQSLTGYYAELNAGNGFPLQIPQTGIDVSLTGNSQGNQTIFRGNLGTYGSNAGNFLGVEISMSGQTNGDRYGGLFYLTSANNSNSGDQYGVYAQIENEGNGLNYGVYSNLSGNGTGDRYAYYALIENTVPGTHYGVYSQVDKSGSYAGYFLGSVSIGTTSANNYILPKLRGSNNQIMQTDGTGNVSWVDLPSGIEIKDNDADTKIQVEESIDEDIIRFDTAGIERMVIASNGSVGINTTGIPLGDFHVKGESYLESLGDTDYWYNSVDGVDDYNFYYNGALRSYIQDTDGSYNVVSDRRFKNDISEINKQTVANIFQLHPVNYYYNFDPTQKKQHGFIAQEVQKLFPELVTEKEVDGETFLTLNYDVFGVLAIKALQEQQNEIEDLKNKLTKMQELEARIAKLEMN